MIDKRQYKRREFRRKAWVAISGGRQLAVFIQDISHAGARLSAYAAAQIPDEFVLLLTPNGAVARQCQVAWTRGAHVGLRFLARKTPPA